MRRSIASLLVLACATGFALRLECLFSCGWTPAASESSTCHATANSGTTLGPGAEVCLDGEASTALAVARTDALAPLMIPPVSAVPAFVAGVDRPFSSLVSIQALAPPPSCPPVPLRI